MAVLTIVIKLCVWIKSNVCMWLGLGFCDGCVLVWTTCITIKNSLTQHFPCSEKLSSNYINNRVLASYILFFFFSSALVASCCLSHLFHTLCVIGCVCGYGYLTPVMEDQLHNIMCKAVNPCQITGDINFLFLVTRVFKNVKYQWECTLCVCVCVYKCVCLCETLFYIRHQVIVIFICDLCFLFNALWKPLRQEANLLFSGLHLRHETYLCTT